MITIERLMDDNKSQQVQDRLYVWEAARDSGDLYLVWACGDSRLVLPDSKSIHILSLGAGGPRSPHNDLISDRGVKAAVVVCHHDGDEAIPGQSPGGCGARLAKASFKGEHVGVSGAKGFVSAHVWDSDLVKQSHTAGSATCYRSDRITLATTQNHLNLAILPLMVFRDGGRIGESEVPQHFLLAEQYFPNMIYEKGLPVLKKEKVPDIFQEFFEENIQQASEIAKKFKDLAFMQKEQNPSLLVITKEARPFSLRYSLDPGEVFRVHLPYQRIDEDTVLKRGQLVDCLQQVDYPVADFSNLDTILIETRRMEQSVKDAKVLVEQPWMSNWLLDPKHIILVSEVRKGITERIVNVKDL